MIYELVRTTKLNCDKELLYLSMDTSTLIKRIESEYDELKPGLLNENSNFKDIIYWNSMNALIMLILIESEYGVIFNDNELKPISTIKELAELIAQKLDKS